MATALIAIVAAQTAYLIQQVGRGEPGFGWRLVALRSAASVNSVFVTIATAAVCAAAWNEAVQWPWLCATSRCLLGALWILVAFVVTGLGRFMLMVHTRNQAELELQAYPPPETP